METWQAALAVTWVIAGIMHILSLRHYHLISRKNWFQHVTAFVFLPISIFAAIPAFRTATHVKHCYACNNGGYPCEDLKEIFR